MDDGEPDDALIEPIISYKHAEIDKLTLELFMNKAHYQKYVSKTNPKKHAETQDFLYNINKYQRSILEITQQLLEEPGTQITTEINDIFEVYSKTLINHIKQRELENRNQYNTADEDTLFADMENAHENVMVENPKMHSFWSKERVNKHR